VLLMYWPNMWDNDYDYQQTLIDATVIIIIKHLLMKP
jgi:hypothetical protein